MSNIRVRKETGRLFLDFRVFGIRCREQTELVDSKANRKLLAKLDENIKVAVANGSYRHEHFFPMSKRIAEVEEARLAIGTPAINKAPANLALAIAGMPPDHPPSTYRQTPLFSDFANQWYSEMEVGWKRSHRTTTRGVLDNSLIPQFGQKTVNEIKKGEILAFRLSLAKLPGIKNKESLSASRINHIMTPLRMILTEAADRYEFAPAFINIKPLRVGKTAYFSDRDRLFQIQRDRQGSSI